MTFYPLLSFQITVQNEPMVNKPYVRSAIGTNWRRGEEAEGEEGEMEKGGGEKMRQSKEFEKKAEKTREEIKVEK